MRFRTPLIRFGTRIAFYPGLWFCRAMAGIRVWRHWDWIDEHLIVGAFPSPRVLRRLHALGVRAIVNLCEEHAGFRDEIERLGMTQLHVPTLDFHPPSRDDLNRAVDFIIHCSAVGEVVYLHCKAGRKRSPLVAIAYLMRKQGLTANEAYLAVRRVRRHIDHGLAAQPVLNGIGGPVAEGP